ncbi:MAG: undecaprenyl/decaprenyl-phosphate alpha-N-acetylglucosaminyl 1-phosphate transferase [Clostridiales Family XIII bacterium]|jgi:UDP-GlcNAc:undecaprenyl-phosphate GlcNAc-1-phosphate transferase|nr:undecaprenyl/decaprenyl-phosphate alpha-N-acetylglucosaminyl 1-phosphate transferase [Clostridiales Family XIII bacterium]
MSLKIFAIASFFTAFALTFLLTPAAIKLAPKIGAVDVPGDGRRMHTKPTPRFGGLGIFAGVMLSIVCFAWFFPSSAPDYPHYGGKIEGLIAGGILIYIVGVLDDLFGLPAKAKFLLQILCASVEWGFGVRITFFTNFFGEGVGYLGVVASLLVTVLWIVGITNTINLVDGLDGLAAGTVAIASLSIAYTAVLQQDVMYMYMVVIPMVAIAGGTLGFLPFNFHPAKIFMGDGGALFLGFMLASVSVVGSVKGATVIATMIPALVLGLPIFDTCFAIFRRLTSGRPIMEADGGHLHHRLMAAGMGQVRSVLTMYGISGVMGVVAVLFSRDLFVESGALFIIAATFVYILLSDAKSPYVNLRGVNAAKVERKERRKSKKF